METEILLVRHGQTAWNVGETGPAFMVRFRGRADIPLSEYGRKEVEALAQRVAAEYQPQVIYSSPLRRAWETAERTGEATGAALRSASALIDVDYGAWQGLSQREAEAHNPAAYKRWAEAADGAAAPGGERLADVGERAWQELNAIAQRHPDACVVTVSHDTVCALLIARALGLPLSDYQRVAQHTAALSVLKHTDQGWRVVIRNDTRHLESV